MLLFVSLASAIVCLVVELEDRLSVLQNDLREKTQAANELTALFQKAQVNIVI